MVTRTRILLVLLSVLVSEGKCSVLTNLALGKNAYQTDTYDGTLGSASHAVDGGLSQVWTDSSCSHTMSFDAFWEVDLGVKAVIDHIIIYNRIDCCSDRLQEVEVYIGDDRNSYQLSAYEPGPVGSILNLQMEANTQGQWVKVTRRVPNDALTLCEVQVMGHPLTAYTARAQRLQAQAGTGTIVHSSATLSVTSCCSLCMTSRRCAAVQYNTRTHSCLLFDTTGHTNSGDNDDLFLVPSAR